MATANLREQITVKLPGPDLASRKTAAAQRSQVTDLVGHGKKVVIDLSTVLSISASYADELFGVLAATHDLGWLRENVKVRGAQEPVLRSIALAVKRRLTTRDRAKEVA